MPASSQTLSGALTQVIRILIVDDSAAVRDGLSAILQSQADFDVVGTAVDGLDGVEKAKELQPDLVIMDAQMPNMDGVEATRRVKRAAASIGILFFTVFPDQVEAGLAAGADGYLLKDCEPDELIAKVSEIASGSGAK